MASCKHSVSLAAQVSAMAALNGVGLALVMPACQSLIADLYEAQQRGRAFGIIMTVAAFGAPAS